MSSHLIAIFNDPIQAERAFHDLQAIVKKEDLSFIQRTDLKKNETIDASTDDIGDGIAIGATMGGIAGAALGIGSFLVPGVGPVLAIGSLYSFLSGMTAGGIIGGLIDLGVNQYTAEKIDKHIQEGQPILTVAVQHPSQEPMIMGQLRSYGAIAIHHEKLKMG